MTNTPTEEDTFEALRRAPVEEVLKARGTWGEISYPVGWTPSFEDLEDFLKPYNWSVDEYLRAVVIHHMKTPHVED